ncbi:MAG: hypothetical protein E7365_00195 [Clostridiales bacterium]|nr:hypothetical protein [Clostridiales bacterium]
MITKKRFRRNMFPPQLILFSVLMVVVITVICLAIFLPKSDKVQYEVIYDGIKSQGFIVRDEVYTDLNNYEKIYFNNIVEGQHITEGTQIASAYKKGYIKNTLDKLYETERNIVTYLNQNIITSFDDKIIQQYDFKIDVIIGKMSQMDNGFIELNAELCSLMSQRVEYIRANYTPDQYLENLYNDEKNLIASIDAWRDYIVANKNGFVGFYCDGVEQLFNSENILNINYSDFNSNIKKKHDNNLNGFKLVTDGKWYVVVEIDNPKDFVVGNFYQVYVSNESEYEYGCLEKIIDEKKGSALVFSFNDNVEKYLDLRVTDVFIGTRSEGYSVKNGFVKNSTAIIKVDKQKTQVPVEILYEDKNKTVFKYTEQISLGQKVYNK